MKSKRNKLLCIVLSFCISLSVVSIECLANSMEKHLSADAVEKLNTIYGENIFSSSDTAIQKSSMKAVLEKLAWTTDIKLDTATNLTRAEACEILVSVFNLPQDNESAIEYLYSQGIVNGYATGDLDEKGDITYAQFAVLTYRILRTLGVGNGTQTQLKPETNDYFNYSYLKARNITIEKDEMISSDLWNEWVNRLKVISDDGTELKNFSCDYPYENTEVSQIAAAKKIVNEYIRQGGANSVFSDVPLGYYCYDGVMYLLDRGIVNGYANGTYGPNDTINRITLAVLLSRIKNTGNDDVDYCKQFAVENGYMIPDDSDENWWASNATRAEVIVAIMKATNADIKNLNPAVLQRFADKDDFADISPYIVYAVMLGLVNGTADGYLNLNGDVTRGQLAILLYRTELGVDTTKIQDYREIVNNILDTNQE